MRRTADESLLGALRSRALVLSAVPVWGAYGDRAKPDDRRLPTAGTAQGGWGLAGGSKPNFQDTCWDGPSTDLRHQSNHNLQAT